MLTSPLFHIPYSHLALNLYTYSLVEHTLAVTTER